MSITKFLEARIAEDEAVVAHSSPHERTGGYTYADVGALSEVLTVGTERVLAECEAKRAIIALHSQSGMRWEGFPRANKQVTYCLEDQHPSPCSTLRTIAAVYKDHPDYQQEWALDG